MSIDEKAVILVVDDNPENLKVVSNFLLEIKYGIALAVNGESALQIVSENKVDLILLDIMMPGMDGFEVCRVLKDNPSTADIPIIFLTAKSDVEDIAKGFQLGGVDYITKPFYREELFARVNSHIQLKLIRDNLIKSELSSRNSRDYYMRVLLDLGKILGRKK